MTISLLFALILRNNEEYKMSLVSWLWVYNCYVSPHIIRDNSVTKLVYDLRHAKIHLNANGEKMDKYVDS